MIQSIPTALAPEDHCFEYDPRQPEGQAEERVLNSDRLAIKLLVAGGFVDEAKANEALLIAHGFESGPLEPVDTALIARPRAQWHEDCGPVVWWAWCGHEWAGEPAWIGRPDDSDWPGYHTHWTPHPDMPRLAGE